MVISYEIRDDEVTEPILGKVFHLVLDSGVDRVLTLEEFRVNRLTKSVKQVLESEEWANLTRYKNSPNDLSIIWVVANQLIANGSVRYEDNKHQRFCRAVKNGTYTTIAKELFGPNHGLVRRWAAALVHELVNEERSTGRVNFEPASKERLIELAFAIEMVATLTFKSEEVENLPMLGRSF